MTNLTRHPVTIFGDTYTLVTDESIDEIERAVAHVNELMNSVAGSAANADAKKIAVLTAVQLALTVQQMQSREREIMTFIDQSIRGH